MENKFLYGIIENIDLVPNEKMDAFSNLLRQYKSHFEPISRLLYEKLDRSDQERFIKWFLKRWANIDTVNPIEMYQYQQAIDIVKSQICESIMLERKKYKIQDLNSQGYDFKLAAYDWVLCIHDVLYNQYEHKDFRVKTGDVIIDAGGFIGDTAALFCKKTNAQCEIHAFEILQENINLFIYNNKINNIENRVVINKFALSNKTGGTVGIKKAPLQGGTAISNDEAAEEQIPTITLDDYVMACNLHKVDLIKMDIEGSEIPALQGAINTIRHFKPKLALCLYHKWDDVITIPKFIEETGIKYHFNFKWVQLTEGWEAVLLASPQDD